jgi:hypothetical protein
MMDKIVPNGGFASRTIGGSAAAAGPLEPRSLSAAGAVGANGMHTLPQEHTSGSGARIPSPAC